MHLNPVGPSCDNTIGNSISEQSKLGKKYDVHVVSKPKISIAQQNGTTDVYISNSHKVLTYIIPFNMQEHVENIPSRKDHLKIKGTYSDDAL